MSSKEYYSVVKLEFGGNNFEANSEEEYKDKVKAQFKEEFGIIVRDEEIVVL
jgi:hypothetical protein